MEYYCPIIIDEVPFAKKDDDSVKGLNLDYFISDDAKLPATTPATELAEEKKPRRTRKSASELPTPPGNQVQIQDDTKIPYSESYNETNAVLQTSIAQSDQLLSEIKQDIDAIRASKTLKSKYVYIKDLTASAASLINTRITAAREINNSITQSHNLELKRTKDLKEFDRESKTDDARMMDLYSAFVGAPVGMYDNGLNLPTIPNMMLGTNDANSGIASVSMGNTPTNNSQLTPEQLRMRFENNPNIEEVVKYDASSGRRWFEAIDKTTGETIQNYPTPDPFLLEDSSIDVRAGVAKNRNLDRVWPLVTVGEISEY